MEDALLRSFNKTVAPKFLLEVRHARHLLLSRWQNSRIPIMIERAQEAIRIQDLTNQSKMEKIQWGMKIPAQIRVNRKNNSPLHA